MRYLSSFWAAFALFFVGALFLPTVVSAAPPQYFQSSLIAGSNLNGPSGFAFAPDGRIFILERAGKIKIYKNGQVLATPFADLPSAASGDRGLIGIAFDPDFATNHYVYFWYTSSGDFLNRLVRFNAQNDIAQDGPVQLYQTQIPSQELHVGGGLAFGPDGKFYVGVGDNGYSANAQNMAVPFGKILRINRDGTIPSDNPYVGQQGVLPEIWANGLRNPWRMQFDPATGQMYISDVGDNSWEEVNRIVRAGNYGWPIVEGMCTQNCGTYINPIHTYNHDDLSSAVTGGPVYRGSMFPASYQGRYFFGDYARGFIKTLTLNAQGDATGVQDFDLNAGSVVDLKQGPDGSLYYITYFPGRLYRITYSTTSQIPVANAGADKTKGLDPLTVNFTSAGTMDPDGDPLTYDWDFGDGTHSTLANPTKTFTQKGTYTVTLHVSDGTNIAEAVPLVIQAGTPPTVNIAAPQDGSLYRAGDTIFFTASGLDGAGFDLHDSDFTTEVLFHHDTHTHPFLGPVQTKTGTFVVPTTGEHDPDVYFEIIITACDTNGLCTTGRVNIYPYKSLYKVDTVPAGLTINIDGVPTQTPYESLGVERYERELEAPLMQTFNGKQYSFDHWSQGGANKQFVAIPENDVVYTAHYVEVPSFTAQYFNNQNLTGTPVLTRLDPTINFEWYAGSPGAGVPTDHFSVRWTRNQHFGAGRYKFTTITDDGVRLYIDGNLVINKWQDQGSVPHSAVVDLTNGVHEVKMEYYDNQYDAIAKLSWEMTPDQPTSPSPSPTATATTTASPTATPSTGYTAEFWNNTGAATSPVIPAGAANVTRTDTAIDFDWGTGAPAAGITVDKFITRWTKQQTFTSGLYRFTTISDDGIRVYIDNQLVINQWNDHGVTTHTGDLSLSEGVHAIRVEFYENGYDAVAKFNYERIGAASMTPSPSASATASPTISPVPTPGAGSTVTIYAAGTQAVGVYPTLELKITENGVESTVATFTGIDGDAINGVYKTYTYTHPRAVSASQVKLAFVNDFYDGATGNDRNVRIDKVRVDGVDFQTEAATTYSEGSWRAADGCAAGYKSSEWIHCGGYMQYSGGFASPTASPSVSPTASPSVSPTTTPSATPAQGYTGEYFANMTLSGTPAVTRQDAAIDFDWGAGAPATGVPVDNFSVRWTRTVTLPSGVYQFKSTGDDGIRLYVDDELILNKWIDQSPTDYIVTKNLTAGSHTIKFEFYEHGYGAVAKMSFVKTGELPVTPSPSASASITPSPIPSITPTATPVVSPTLTPSPTPTASPAAGYLAEYWNTPGVGSAPAIPVTAPTLSRTETVIDNYWGLGSPHASITVDKFIARWTKQQVFVAGTYTFTTESDDGIRVYIDNQLVIDQWNDHGVTTHTGVRTLTAGTHDIRVEYYENGLDAIAKFNFVKQ